MAEFNDIPEQDYSFLDDVLSKSLDNYRKKLFGNYDDKTGYFEEADVEDEIEGVSEGVTNGVSDVEETEQGMTDDEYYNDVFDEQPVEFATRPTHGGGEEPKPSNSSKFQKFATYEEGKKALINQLKIYQEGRSKTGIKPTSTLLQAMSIYAPASDNNNPAHYADFVAKKIGVDVNTPISKLDTKKWADAIEIMEGNKGTNPGNLKKFQRGGTPVAKTKQQQHTGLNDPELDQLYMPLQGNNPIRGLDSGKPVYVQDTIGNEHVLYGPDDVIYMDGPVYEKRMQTGGNIPNIGSQSRESSDYTETARYSLENSKKIKISKNGDFKGLIPMDAWTDDMLNYIDKFKIITKGKERFVKVRGSLKDNTKPVSPDEVPEIPFETL